MLEVKAKVEEVTGPLKQHLSGKDTAMMRFMSNKKLTGGWLISHHLDEGYFDVLAAGSPTRGGEKTGAKVLPSSLPLYQQLWMHIQKTLLGTLTMLLIWGILVYSWIKPNSHTA